MPALQALKAAGYNAFEDMTAVDWYPSEPRFQLSYHILSHQYKERIRLRAMVSGDDPAVESSTVVWPGANYYEREVFDLFGVRFEGHPNLRRILMPEDWTGHPLAQGLSGGGLPLMADFDVGTPILEAPVAEGAKDQHMVLNMGPQHPSTHGVLRLVLEVDGEIVVRLYPEIGYLHTGIEKTCEAKFYQQVVPLTDRVDYLGPMANNLCYCLAVEKLLQLEIPDRAQWLRVMFTELTRLNSHLIWLGTHAMDIGALTVFLYTFREREDILRIFEEVAGQRMMTSYFRIGGLAMEPPLGLLEQDSGVHQDAPGEDRRVLEPADGKSDLSQSAEGCGHVFGRRRDCAGDDRADDAGFGNRFRPAAGHAVLELREVSVQGAGFERVRLLGAVRSAAAGDAREREDCAAGAGWDAGGSGQGRCAEDCAAGPREDEDADGGADPSLQDRDGGVRGAGRRGVSGDRVGARTDGLLRGFGWNGEAVSGAHAVSVVCDFAGAGDDVQGADAGRCGGGDRVD